MSTLTKNQPELVAGLAPAKEKTDLFDFIDSLESARFAVAPLLLTAMACLGGIAAAFAADLSEAQLLAVAVTSTFVEVLVIALAPMRMIAAATAIALFIDLIAFIA